MLRVSVVLLLLVAVLASARVASAASVHLETLKFTDEGVTLNATGALSGLGNEDVLITLTATAATPTCTNQGGVEARGQNLAEVTVTGSQAIPASEIENGNVAFNVTTQPPDEPTATAAEAGCPSDNWSASITDLAFIRSSTITVQNIVDVIFSYTNRNTDFNERFDVGPPKPTPTPPPPP